MSEVLYLQFVLSGPVPFLGGSAPVLLPMYFWQITIFLLESPMIVMLENVADRTDRDLRGYLFLWSGSYCFVPISRPQMTETPPGGADAAAAGAMLIAAMLVCGAAGYGLGYVVGLAVPLGLAGLFVGLVVGFALVYARYRRL